MANKIDDIAIIGYACRLPSANDVSAFWEILSEGRCVVSEVNSERWGRERYGHPSRGTPGKTYTWAAGQIDDVWGFDPGFFGISPREAVQIDPQQRLLLQVAWEAVEHAGIPASKLAGSRTGVYVGASSLDYGNQFLFDPAAADVQLMTGNTLSIISNRVSYALDLRGPSFTVDTACSSSLVALHEALEAIRAGRIDTAIVAGVNLLLSPLPFIGFSQASMLSPTGLCRAFDADGDGYVRSEGAVAVVLRASAAARSAGDSIRGLVVGSGINADGRTVGLSLPSSEMQAALLDEVYDRTGIAPDDLAFVEAHGTGTRVGDPLEAFALGSILGRRRRARLPIGSVKTNVGHLEPASGLAGLLKAQLALENDLLPPSLHFDTPNPDIAFADLNLEVVSTATPLPRGDRQRFVGINSFGFGGANAHVIIADAQASPVRGIVADAAAPLVISAQTKDALAALATRYRSRIESADEAEVARIVNGAAYGRDRLEHRLVVLGRSKSERLQALGTFLAGEPSTLSVEGRALARESGCVFLFSGNGSQWAGMGRAAYQSDRDFRLAYDRTDRAFMSVAGWSLLTALFSPDLDTEIERTEIAQPLLFAVQSALYEALARRGVTPSAVAGHSVGEVAAAYAAGALTLDQAVRVIHARSTHQEITRHLGGMAALLMSAEKAAQAIDDPRFAGIELAAINSPRSVTISGPGDALDAFVKHARKARWATKRLDLDYPFHCQLVDPIHDPLVASLAALKPRQGRIPFVSAVTGEIVDGETLDANYWWENVRRPVRFEAAVRTLAGLGHRLFLEIGPRPVLSTYVTDTLRSMDVAATILPSLDRNDEQVDVIGAIAAAVLASGGRVDEAKMFGPRAVPAIDLPNYPWQNRPYRIGLTSEAITVITDRPHALLGSRLRPNTAEWFNHLDTRLVPWLADHKVEDSVVLPAAAFAEMALTAARQWHGVDAVELRDFDIIAPLVLDASDMRETMVRLSHEDGGIEILSRARLSGEDWSMHARGRVSVSPGFSAELPAPTEGEGTRLTADRLYRLTESFGLRYGPVFRRAHAVTTYAARDVEVELAPSDPATAAADFTLDPTLLDACFHGLFALIEARGLGRGGSGTTVLPVRFGTLRVDTAAGNPVSARISLTKSSQRSVVATFTLFDGEGAVVAVLEGARFQRVTLSRADTLDSLTYRVLPKRLPGRDGEAPSVATAAIEALRGLVVADGAEAEIEEAALLFDAAVRSAAAEVLVPLIEGPEGGDVDALVLAGRIAADARPLAVAMLQALEQSDIVAYADGRWQATGAGELPAVGHIVRTLVAEHPERIAEATLAARLPGALAERFANGLAANLEDALSSGLVEHFLTASPTVRALGEAAGRTVAAIAADWPRSLPLRVLCAGSQDTDLIRRLAESLDPRLTEFVITDPEDSRLERARLRLSGLSAAEFATAAELAHSDRGFDLVVSSGRLSAYGRDQLPALVRLLVPDGALVAFELAPAAALDAIFGLTLGWWRDSTDPHLPVGRAPAGGDWARILSAAGLSDVSAEPLASEAADALVVVGRRQAQRNAEPAAAAAGGRVVVVGDAAGPGRALAEAIATEIRAGGRDAVVAVTEPEAEDGDAGPAVLLALDRASDTASATLAELLAGGERGDVVFALGSADDGAAVGTLTRRLDRLAILLVRLADERPRLWIVAPGAMQSIAGGHANRPTQAAVWGFGRVALNEFPDLEVRLLDVTPVLDPAEMAVRLAKEILDPGAEREIVLDTDARSGLRIVRGGLLPRPLAGGGGAAGLRLDTVGHGIDGLAWRPFVRRAPEGDEVEIEVGASGLNFRDVMWALGLLPEEALEDGFAGPTIGMECSGRVVRVGPKATRYRVGDPVIAFAPACFASHVTVAERAAAPMPSALSTEAAATVPVAFLTAYYALVRLGMLEEGETVLIHGGAGGVGLAALQIARWRGARVIATAGSREKRALLTALGADHVLNSRSLAFADEVMALTGGAGVDMVLNSLAGDAMERSIGIVKPFGRFLELGKRDYYANTRIGLRPFRRNVSYFGIDADQLLTEKPKLANQLFTELVQLFEDGALTPLPYRSFDAASVADAFRLMQQSGHVGKIVVAPPRVAAAAEPTQAIAIRDDRSYLVAGGVGGFGFEAARWLADNGARHIVLASRSGRTDEATTAAIEALAAQGVTVTARACDLTDAAQVDDLVAGIHAAMPPLAGVLHTAMVLDDALIQNLDADRIAAVLAPKVAGAENLDRATQSIALDFFVLYSSATTLVGNPGQANYVAANAYLEALARRRRAAGHPGLAVAWGAIADAGYLARNMEVSNLLARKLGRHALSAAEAVAGLGELISVAETDAETAAIGFGRIDWSAARKDLALVSTPIASGIVVGSADQEAGSASVDVRALIEGLDTERATDAVSKLLAGEIARILRLPAEEVDRHRPLAAIGMDSLMALELRVAAEQRLGIDIPLMSLANGATLTDISRRILARLGGGEDGQPELGEDAEQLAKSHVEHGEISSPDAAAIAEVVEEHSRKIRKIIG